jgi:6-pyruvoyltetrahydropterin/6-carboxytetrahydropterin synthase
MFTEISREYHIEAAHRLPNVPEGHKCARLHGHSFKITLFITGEVDPHTGWIIDFGQVDQSWQTIHNLLDHRYLNEVLGLENPTSETLARWVLERVKLPRGRLTAVAVAETCRAACKVYADRTE